MSPREPAPRRIRATPPVEVESWCRALERRHLATRTLPEVRRAVRALSRRYVERGPEITTGAALDGEGKRAAFALYFGPLHYLTVRAIADAIAPRPRERVVDLGCGSGAVGAAFAGSLTPTPRVEGLDVHPWAVREAAWNYRSLRIDGRARRASAETFAAGARDAVVAGWVVNEMRPAARDRLAERLLEAARGGTTVLVVEPIAKRPSPWWSGWRERFEGLGGSAATWRIATELPDVVARLDRAARLDHRELTARSLFVEAAGAGEDSRPAPTETTGNRP